MTPVVKTKINAEDGYELTIQQYIPVGSHQGKTILIAAATGIRKEFYQKFASYFAAQGIQVVTFDYRGIGESLVGDLKKSDASMAEWGHLDVSAVLMWIQSNFPNDQIFFVGHSIGAHILGLAKHTEKINGVILIASACAYWKNYGIFYRQFMWFLYFVIFPVTLKYFKYFPSKLFSLGEDLPPKIAKNWGYWGTQKNYLYSEYPKAIDQLKRLNIPVLAYSFQDDWITPPIAVKQLLDFYPNTAKQWSHLSPKDVGVKAIGHNGYFRNGVEKTLWSDTLNWIKQFN